MKKLFILILALLICGKSFSQSKDSLTALADAVVKSFTWDIQKADRGSIMFLDVPYSRDQVDSVEYLTLAVAKDKTKDRPDFISVIVPDNVVKSNGIFISFAKTITVNGERNIEIEKVNPVRLLFEGCKNQTCTARIINGYARQEDGSEQDIFNKFLSYDHVLFLFVYPDGTHKSVAVPLFSFKDQYKTL